MTTAHNNLGNYLTLEDCTAVRLEDLKKGLKPSFIRVNGIEVQFTYSGIYRGGKRRWFVCPSCQRRCGVLYGHPFTDGVNCQKCIGLLYRKQRYKGMVEAGVPTSA